MKARSAMIQGGLAVAGLLAAYVTWQRPKDTARPDAVSVFSATKQSLEKVHFDDGSRFVDVVRKTEGEPRLWVTLGFLPGKEPAMADAGVAVVMVDAGVDAGMVAAAVKPAPPTPTREMLANERADTLFQRFMPFDATRALGQLPKEKLDELGLTASDRRLEVTIAGQVRRFTVSRPVPGIIGSYVQDDVSHDVYLVQGSVFSELDPGSQLLVDRRLHVFKQPEFDAFIVESEGKSVEFVQTGAEIPQSAKVARAATPDKPDELAKNWHDKILNRLVVTDVLGKGELPRAGEPKARLRIEYRSHAAKKGWLEIGFDPQNATWARSENTASWVAIHQGSEEIVAEAQKLLK